MTVAPTIHGKRQAVAWQPMVDDSWGSLFLYLRSSWGPSLGILVLLWMGGVGLVLLMGLYGDSLPSLSMCPAVFSHPLTHLALPQHPASHELHRLGPCSPAIDSHVSGPKVRVRTGQGLSGDQEQQA